MIDCEPEVKAKSARTAMLFSRTNTLLSLPMLLSMVAPKSLLIKVQFSLLLFPKFYNLPLKNFSIGEATKIDVPIITPKIIAKENLLKFHHLKYKLMKELIKLLRRL